MEKRTLNISRLAALAGMTGALLFVAVFTLEGWLRPAYDPRAMYVSALSLGQRGWIQIANFIFFGVLLFVFTRGVAVEFPSGKASRGGLTLLTLIAFCYLLSGPFVMDPMGTPAGQTTLTGAIHGILGAIAFILMPISCFVYLRRFNVDPNWRSLRGWTLVLGTVSAAAVVLLSVVSKIPQFESAFADWLGLIQRALIIPFMTWVLLFGRRLYQRSKTA